MGTEGRISSTYPDSGQAEGRSEFSTARLFPHFPLTAGGFYIFGTEVEQERCIGYGIARLSFFHWSAVRISDKSRDQKAAAGKKPYSIQPETPAQNKERQYKTEQLSAERREQGQKFFPHSLKIRRLHGRDPSKHQGSIHNSKDMGPSFTTSLSEVNHLMNVPPKARVARQAPVP